MEVPFGKFLLNQRAKATTAKDISALPINNKNGKWSPDDKKEEAFPSIIIPVEFFAQKHVNMCGDACVNMLYAAAKKKPPVNMKQNTRGVMEGLDNDAVREAHGDLIRWRPNWVQKDQSSIRNLTPMRLAFGLKQNGPMMFSGSYARFIGKRWGHWIVVHGIVEENVYIADPWHGENRHKSFSWLMEHAEKENGDLPLHMR